MKKKSLFGCSEYETMYLGQEEGSGLGHQVAKK